MNALSLLLVGAGGFLGSVARYLTVQFVDGKVNAVFPYGTLVVNVTGAFILGFVTGLMMRSPSRDPRWSMFLTTGFCGGFTTFSAFALENARLLEERLPLSSLLYIIASVILSVVAVFAGMLASKMAD